jgi:hypothetical protein
MTLPVREPDLPLAYRLLADGNNFRALRRFAGFQNLQQAREFAQSPETAREVRVLVEQRIDRLGAKALTRLEGLLDSDSIDTRALVASIRTAMEASGHFRRDQLPPVKHLANLTVAEIDAMISQARVELERAQAAAYRQPVALIAPS